MTLSGSLTALVEVKWEQDALAFADSASNLLAATFLSQGHLLLPIERVEKE